MRVEQLRDLKLSEDNCDARDVSYFDRMSALECSFTEKMLKRLGFNLLTTNFWIVTGEVQC